MAEQGIKVCIDVDPGGDTEIFRSRAADAILRILADDHETAFTIPELVDATGVARSTVWRAVNLLDSIGVISIDETPQRNYISIDPARLQKDDPVLAIDQPEFHDPIRAFTKEVRTALQSEESTDLLGIIVFGSVARGEADRRSDIDVFVVVSGDRTEARRLITDVATALQEQRFSGDRFEFETYVESVESMKRAAPKLREIFDEGVTIYRDDRLGSLRKEVYSE